MEVKNVGVVGCGTRGSGIVQVIAQARGLRGDRRFVKKGPLLNRIFFEQSHKEGKKFSRVEVSYT